MFKRAFQIVVVAILLIIIFAVYDSRFPTLFVESDTDEVEALVGSSCWNYVIMPICKDYKEAESLVEDMDTLRVEEGQSVELDYSRRPDKIEIRDYSMDSGISFLEDSFVVPSELGEHIIIVHSRYGRGSVTHVFKLLVE